MRKSIYGKETAFVWEAEVPLTHEQVVLREVASTLEITPMQAEEIKRKFDESRTMNRHLYDGDLWRYEGYKTNGGIDIDVSPVTYPQHNVLREEKNKPFSFYPNPISINAVQVTADGYIPIGFRGKVADQKGLCTLGSGFVKRGIDPDTNNNYEPDSLFSVAKNECKSETKYNVTNPSAVFDLEEMRALGMVFGSNHDTTACIYVPLKADRRCLDLGNKEHSDLLWLHVDYDSLQRFLHEGGMEGMPAADHLLGDIELFALNKIKGYLDAERQGHLLMQ